MFWIFIICIFLFAGWISYETLKNPPPDDDSIYDPTTTCWDDDKNHTEGGFH